MLINYFFINFNDFINFIYFMTEKELLIEKIKEIAGWNISPFRLRIITDTSDWMSKIGRAHV